MKLSRLARLFHAEGSPLDPLRDTDRPQASFEAAWRGAMKRRILVVLGVICLWAVGIQARLVQLQVFQHTKLSEMARRSQQQTIEPEAMRGDIVDRNGNMLAYSVEAESIVADPSRIKEPESTLNAVCGALGDCTAKERRDLLAKLSADSQYALIRRARAVSPAQVARVEALKLKGIVFQPETRRYYPRYELAAHVIGYVGLDNNGQAGIEYARNKDVHGQDGLAFAQVDAKRQRLETRVEREPVPGATVELTLDLYLQHIAERELKRGVEENKAAAGTAIIMHPKTGEILAMANYPTFNPNAVGRSDADVRRNRAVQDVYEPGSTFKMVTASAALEEGIVKPEDMIDTNPGSITIPGRARPIFDTSRHGVISFQEVIMVSSNVGAIKVGLRTGAERMTRYVHRFGFGEALAPDFIGQSRGLWTGGNMSDSALASASMGYQIGVTPLQIVTAASAIANGGLLMEPHIVRAIIRNGQREAVAPKALRRAVSSQTAATLTTMMEGVVSPHGTARIAMLDGYQVAGKTGTANKVVNGAYSPTEFNASFVGFVPSRQPEFAVLVVIDSPRGPNGHYGGPVSGPIFKRIADAILRQTGLPPTVDPAPPLLVSNRPPSLPDRPVNAMALSTPTFTPVGGVALVPDVTGLSAREAVRVFAAVGLTTRVRGEGFVASQWPEAGRPVDAGSYGVVQLQRTWLDGDGTRGRR